MNHIIDEYVAFTGYSCDSILINTHRVTVQQLLCCVMSYHVVLQDNAVKLRGQLVCEG